MTSQLESADPQAVDPQAVVKEFCAVWSRRDIEEILSWFTEDGIYHNIPMPAAVGLDAIRNLLGMIVAPSESIEFDILRIASAGDIVFTERIDRLLMGGRMIELPVAGVFEVRDGKIAAWRDYFDMQMFMQPST